MNKKLRKRLLRVAVEELLLTLAPQTEEYSRDAKDLFDVHLRKIADMQMRAEQAWHANPPQSNEEAEPLRAGLAEQINEAKYEHRQLSQARIAQYELACAEAIRLAVRRALE